MRVPLKFGASVMREVILLRVRATVRGRDGRESSGWGETPMSIGWGWPSQVPYEKRMERFMEMIESVRRAWENQSDYGHPLEIGHDFLNQCLPALLKESNITHEGEEPMPWLAALIISSAFDLAIYDAYGNHHREPVYNLYSKDYLTSDLSRFLEPSAGSAVSFKNLRPDAFFVRSPERKLSAWHLVGGLDALQESDLDGSEPLDGYPTTLEEWIQADGLTCLKIKLRGNDSNWDYERIVKVGRIALDHGAKWLSLDFNCTAPSVDVVVETLDRLLVEEPSIHSSILYVEQPFPYDLQENLWDVSAVSKCKPLFMDESAHDWEMVRLGRSVGWSGVALKTCKTQTSAILTACWAKAHGMPLMVQDLTNPSLAMIPHALLASHVGTICGVETNACQFYPDFSAPEASIHGGLYRRRNGCIDLSTISGPGFGYRLDEICRRLDSFIPST